MVRSEPNDRRGSMDEGKACERTQGNHGRGCTPRAKVTSKMPWLSNLSVHIHRVRGARRAIVPRRRGFSDGGPPSSSMKIGHRKVRANHACEDEAVQATSGGGSISGNSSQSGTWHDGKRIGPGITCAACGMIVRPRPFHV
eukprot:scaffold435_cov342-Pavlova_lutheri.AAC.27